MKYINEKGFTLLEMLVVVLIIGILAGIALPQYRIAVTKARVASILPLMRRWKDASMEYKLQHGYYCSDEGCPTAEELGVNWPSDWRCDDGEARTECFNDYWYCDGLEPEGAVWCTHHIDLPDRFNIIMYQPDYEGWEDVRGMTTCNTYNPEEQICKALGGKLIDSGDWGAEYQLN